MVAMNMFAQSLDFIPTNHADLRQAVIHMAACINFADWQFIKLVAEMDRTRAWRYGGFCSLVNWLDYHCGLGTLAARERIRIGRNLTRLPHIDEAFHRGEINYSKVRAVTRVANGETDRMMLALAKSSSANELERLVRTYERTDGVPAKSETSSFAGRTLDWHYENGMLIIHAELPAEQGAMVVQALQSIVDGKKVERQAEQEKIYYDGLKQHSQAEPENVSAETFGANTGGPAGEDLPDILPTAFPQSASPQSEPPLAASPLAASPRSKCPAEQQAELQVEHQAELQAEHQAEHQTENQMEQQAEHQPCTTKSDLADDLGPPAGLVFDLSSPQQRHADAMVDIAEHYLASAGSPKKRRPGRRYEVVLHIDRNELAQQQQQLHEQQQQQQQQQGDAARYYVEPGWGVDASAARQISCDADITEFIQDRKGNILDFKSRARTVPAKMRRALELRDGHCQFPGCHHSRYVEAHHIIHWVDGGETTLDNLILLCSSHHRLHHLGEFNIAKSDNEVTFLTKWGEVITRTVDPQFPNVSAEALACNGEPVRPCRNSSLRSRSDEDIVGLIHYRETWRQKKPERFMRWLKQQSQGDSLLFK